MTRLVLALAALCLAAAAPIAQPPRFDAAGRLDYPTNYRDWVFLSSGLDMSYSAHPAMPGGTHMFNNVFVQPGAVAYFRHTGHWPDGTMLVLENRSGASKGSINQHGVFQTGTVMGLEVHVRDAAHFPGGWGFFSFDGSTPARLIPRSASCYACHQAHGAVDTTFTQFYPTMLPIARHYGTVHAELGTK